MNQVAALLAVVALAVSHGVAAQVASSFDPVGPRGNIVGHVTLPAGAGIADVSISLPGGRRGTVSDSAGRFSIEAVDAGPVELRFERVGYASRTIAVDVLPGSTTRVEAAMSPEAIELAPIDVQIGHRLLEENGFYRRARSGSGLQLSREQLDEQHVIEVSDAVRNSSGVILGYDPYMASRVIAKRSRGRRIDGRACPLTVYIDGVRTLDPDLNQVPAEWLLGMEMYLGAETPARFRGSGACGVVLLWTMDGR